MKEFKIGHFTNLERGTGCTVILCPEGSKGSGVVRGAAPATREYALLDPRRKVEEIHALFLTGGSAFGLDAAAGVMRYLAERGIGYPTTFGKIPIVPAAVIYDLYTRDASAFPTAEDAYQACRDARSGNTVQGNVGAGTGATVGKWAGLEFQMKGGLGISRIDYRDWYVQALVVANPVGDVLDPEGNIIAGAQRDGKFLAQDDPRVRWAPPEVGFGENTVLAAVMTNAKLSKLQLHVLAERAHNGIARTVVPAHTGYDGDIIFSLCTGEVAGDPDFLSEMAVTAVQEAIVNGVKSAETLAGIPGKI